MPKVHNKYRYTAPDDAVYVGRPSKFGNPFVVGKDGDRNECVEKFRDYLKAQPELLAAARSELRGKDLVCFCAPQRCHAEILIEVAND